MRAVSVIIGIIVILLWLLSATYIAAPASVLNLFPTLPLGAVPVRFLGVVFFLLSLVLIFLWAAITKDAPEEVIPSATTFPA
jgi:hypothetical protein